MLLLYVFIGFLIIAIILAVVSSLYTSTYFLIVTGTFVWLYALFFMEAQWRHQLAGICMISIGVFLAHIWEELFRDKGKSK